MFLSSKLNEAGYKPGKIFAHSDNPATSHGYVSFGTGHWAIQHIALSIVIPLGRLGLLQGGVMGFPYDLVGLRIRFLNDNYGSDTQIGSINFPIPSPKKGVHWNTGGMSGTQYSNDQFNAMRSLKEAMQNKFGCDIADFTVKTKQEAEHDTVSATLDDVNKLRRENEELKSRVKLLEEKLDALIKSRSVTDTIPYAQKATDAANHR
jgi:hypothetical protein